MCQSEITGFQTQELLHSYCAIWLPLIGRNLVINGKDAGKQGAIHHGQDAEQHKSLQVSALRVFDNNGLMALEEPNGGCSCSFALAARIGLLHALFSRWDGVNGHMHVSGLPDKTF